MTTPKEEAAEPVDDRIESATRKLKALKRDFGMKGTNATTIERAIDLMRSIGRAAPPQPSGEVERMREALISIREECNNAGKWSDIVRERMIERIELEAVAALADIGGRDE